MKKNVSGILFSLALMIGLMMAIGTTAYADTSAPDSPYKLWVGDIAVTSENAANITNSDPVQASYNAATNTLTLNNYTYEGSGIDYNYVEAAINAGMDNDNLTIELFGTNIVTHRYEYEEIDDSTPGAGIYVKNNLTFTGAGTLKVSDGNNKITTTAAVSEWGAVPLLDPVRR